MASAAANKRLRTEYRDLQKKGLENIKACPKETNILEWHYVIAGPKDSPYAGGYYHGIVRFPPEYPYKPPAILMQTPNGRFRTQTKLCLSMSDFHPESWNPMWSVATILMGLYSFMLENTPTQGSIETSSEQKKKFARESLEYNCQNKVFCDLFPEFVEMHHEQEAAALKARQELADIQASLSMKGSSGGTVPTDNNNILSRKAYQQEGNASMQKVDGNRLASWSVIAGLVGVVSICLYLMISYSIVV